VGTISSTKSGQTQWTSKALNLDPRGERYLQLRVSLDQTADIEHTTIWLQWSAFAAERDYRIDLPLSLSDLNLQGQQIPKKLRLVFPVGDYVDWTFAERITALTVSASKAVRILSVEFPILQADRQAPDAVLTHYLYPEKKFLMVGESRVAFEP